MYFLIYHISPHSSRKSKIAPEGWLQIQHPRLNIEFFRNLSFRQSIQRSSPIVDHYYPLRWSVPISACPLTASDAGCTSDVPITWVLDLALYRYYSIDARCSQFAPTSRMSMGNFFENIFLVFCALSPNLPTNPPVKTSLTGGSFWQTGSSLYSAISYALLSPYHDGYSGGR